MTKPVLAFVILLAIAAGAHAESALTTRSTELQEQSQSDAATLATLPANTRVDVLRRSGAWSEVKTAEGQTGWVRMMSLKLGSDSAAPAAGKSGSGNPAQALSSLLASGRTSNTATTTTGVKGLTTEDLQNAKANPAEVQKLQKFASGKDVAQAFAQRSSLEPVKVDYLAEPDAGESRSRRD